MAAMFRMPIKRALHFIRELSSDGALALCVATVIGFVIASLAAAGIITMTLAIAFLALAWMVAVVGSYLGPRPFPRRHRIVFAIILALLLSVIGWYEEINYEKPPSADEIAAGITKKMVPPVMPHARLEHNAINFPEENPGGNRRVVIHFRNNGAIEAAYVLIIGAFSTVEHEYSKQEQDSIMESILDKSRKAQPLSPVGSEVFVGADVQLTMMPPLTPDDWAAIINGRKLLYVFAAAKFSDRNLDPSEYWLSEACFKLERSLSGGAPCVGHFYVHKERQ